MDKNKLDYLNNLNDIYLDYDQTHISYFPHGIYTEIENFHFLRVRSFYYPKDFMF